MGGCRRGATVLIDRADFADLAEPRRPPAGGMGAAAGVCGGGSALHRRVWAGAEPPRRLEGLAELPLVDKEMLRESQRAHPPFGDYLAAPGGQDRARCIAPPARAGRR